MATSGAVSGAYTFDGINDELSIQASATLQTVTAGPHTISAWVYLSATPTVPKFIVDAASPELGASQGDQRGLRFHSNSTPVFKWVTTAGPGCQFPGNGTAHCLASNAGAGLGQWRHVVGVYDGSAGRIYVDGQLTGEMASVGTPTVARIWKIGNVSTGGTGEGYFKGRIDDVRVYSGALSPAHVVALYNLRDAPPPAPSAGLIAHFPLDGGRADDLVAGRPGETSNVSAVADRNGVANGAMRFTSSANWARVPFGAGDSLSLTTRDQFTVSVWINADRLPPGPDNAVPIGIGYQGFAFGLQVAPNGQPVAVACTPSEFCRHAYGHAGTISPGAWNHLALRYDGLQGRLSFFLNGNHVTTSSVSFSNRTADRWVSIGNPAWAPQFVFLGSIDDGRIYDRLLTDDEIRALSARAEVDVVINHLETPSTYDNARGDMGQTFEAIGSSVSGVQLYINDPVRPGVPSVNELVGPADLVLWDVANPQQPVELQRTEVVGAGQSVSGLNTFRFDSSVPTVVGRKYPIGLATTDTYGLGIRALTESTYGGGAEAHRNCGWNLACSSTIPVGAVVEDPYGRDVSFAILK